MNLQLYGFGSNGSGQLGLGHLEDSNTPQPCIGIPNDESIKKVVGGGNHSAVLTKSGRLYMAGSSQLGSRQQKIWEREQQTDGSLTREHYDWTIYNEPFPQHIWHDVACGWAFTILVNDQGKVFGIGSSSFGELGMAVKDTMDLVAIESDLLDDIDSVACGWRHCIALDRTGKVYGWGWGKYGQLGIQIDSHQGKPPTILPPSTIDVPEQIATVACGHLHSLFLGARTGKVYGCGVNKNGQIGSTMGISNVMTPTPCHGFADGFYCDQNTTGWQLTTGWHHSALLPDNGKLLMWGKNDHGQVQNGLAHVKKVVSGSEHVLAQLDDEQVVAWGWNEHGNCTTDNDKVLAPITVHLPQHTGKILLIGAGCATSWIGVSAR